MAEFVNHLTIGAGVVVAIASCAPPTEIHVSVYTDVACDTNAEAVIIGGATLEDLTTKAPASSSTQCTLAPDGTNSLGDVVLQPSGDKSAEIAFEIMIRPDGSPADDCNDPSNAASCIVARRQIHFSSYSEIDMRVDLRLSCLGVVCPSDQTCVEGQCVESSTTCTGNTCDDSSLVSQGSGSHFARLAGGASHTCAITATGGVKCWGSNEHGELGNASNTDSPVPVDVVGLQSGAISLAAGQDFSCALMTTRTVKCWGKNDFGELGNGANTDSNVPVDTLGVTGAASIAMGCKHVCVSLESGGAQCWGWNDEGQLGDGTTNNNSNAVTVQNLTNAEFITAGFHSSCAAIPGGARCWGDDSMGELGDGQQTASSIPVIPTQLPFSPLLMSSGAYHVFAASFNASAATDQFASWGENAVTGGVQGVIDAVGAGDGYTCVLQSGKVLCWGENGSGQLGQGTTGGTNNTAAPVNGLSGVTVLGIGFDHACVFIGPNAIQCWGTNSNGQLGNNSTTDSNVPVKVVWP